MKAIRTRATLLLMVATMALILFKTGQARPGIATRAKIDNYPLVVCFDATNLAPGTVQLYQNITNVLNGYTGLPDNRTNFFSAYNDNNGYSIYGWQGAIVAAQQNCNGYLVTLNVIPELGSTFGTDCCITDLNYSEQYQVNNDNTFVYIGSLDPNNRAGLLSSRVDAY